MWEFFMCMWKVEDGMLWILFFAMMTVWFLYVTKTDKDAIKHFWTREVSEAYLRQIIHQPLRDEDSSSDTLTPVSVQKITCNNKGRVRARPFHLEFFQINEFGFVQNLDIRIQNLFGY